MIGKNGGNFLTAHYEWIAAAVAAAALVAGGVMFAGSLGADPGELASRKAAEVKRIPPGGEPVQKPDLSPFTMASNIAKNPTSLKEVTDDAGSFLASEARILCTNCLSAVVKGPECPLCKAVLEEVKPEDKDADGDGMPNDWERKFGLNANDPADASLDKDGDGFTNLEEYEAQTDPTDKDSHPDYLDSVTVQLPLVETKLPFFFTGTMKTPSGLKFQFKDPTRAKEFDRGVYSVLAGEEIGKSGYVAKEYVEKTVEKTMGGGMKKKVDASEAVVARKSDGKKVSATIGKKGVPVDVQAKLAYARDGKTFDVVAGDVIDLNGTKYVVKAVKGTEKGATVTLANEKTGKVKILSAP